MANKKTIIYISAAILVVGVAVYSRIKYLNKKRDSENVNEEKEPLFRIDTVLDGSTDDDYNVQFTFGDTATGYNTYDKEKTVKPYTNKASKYELLCTTNGFGQVVFSLFKADEKNVVRFIKILKTV